MATQEAKDRYLTVREVAERYRTTESTVHGWVYKRTAPPSIRVGKRRLFALSDLLAWEADLADREGANDAA